jgi:hypothetical protein
MNSRWLSPIATALVLSLSCGGDDRTGTGESPATATDTPHQSEVDPATAGSDAQASDADDGSTPPTSPRTSNDDPSTDGESGDDATSEGAVGNPPRDPVSPAPTGTAPSDGASQNDAPLSGADPIAEAPTDAGQPGDSATSDTGMQSPSEPSSAGGPTLPDGSPPADLAPDGASVDPVEDPNAISCDPRELQCRRAAPECAQGEVPRIIDGCYAECVTIDSCVCDSPDACPNPDEFTCINSTNRCSYYLR